MTCSVRAFDASSAHEEVTLKGLKIHQVTEYDLNLAGEAKFTLFVEIIIKKTQLN